MRGLLGSCQLYEFDFMLVRAVPVGGKHRAKGSRSRNVHDQPYIADYQLYAAVFASTDESPFHTDSSTLNIRLT